MPVIKQVGITEGGAFWVMAGKSRDYLPNGNPFHGFSRIEDDLGRTYFSVGGGHRFRDDTSLDIFVPIDFPFDERIPSKVTLIREPEAIYLPPNTKPELIGTVELTEWEHDASCPELSGQGTKSDSEFKNILAGKLLSRKDNERLERLMQSMTGEPEDGGEGYEREKMRLSMLVNNDQFDEAVVLGERLMPLLIKEFQRWKRSAPSLYIFNDYLISLACSGQNKKTKETWERIKILDPNIPVALNQQAKKRIKDEIQYDLDICLRIIVPDLSREAHLTIEQLNSIFDIDIKNNESFRHYSFWDWNPEFEKPKYKNWERHLEELAEYYKSHPLPDKMEILERDKKEEFGTRKRDMPGIDSHYVENFQRTLQRWAKSYRFSDLAGCVRIEGDIPDIELNHDLVYQKDTPTSEIILFVLKHFGLEIVDVNEPRTVWIASYDGRELKDFREVVAPIPYDSSGERKAGMMISSSSGGWDLEYLFKTFMRHQNEDYKAQGILIINQTGIIDKISREGPNWRGPEAIEMARKWFKDEFGITFTEESREMKTYVIRKREK